MSGGLASKPWIINHQTSNVPKTIENIKQFICITINTEKVLQKGARGFDEFKSDSEGEHWETFFQLFLKLCENLRDELYNKKDRIPEGTKPLEFFIEAIRGSKTTVKNYTGYTFYCILHNVDEENCGFEEENDTNGGSTRKKTIDIDINRTFRNLVNEISKGHINQDKNSKEKPGNYYDGRVEQKKHHKWKRLNSISQLCQLSDLNFNYVLASNHSDMLFTKDLSSNSNLLSACKLFNFASSMGNRGNKETMQSDVYETQRIVKQDSYIEEDEDGNSFSTIHFPENKYVIRIPISEMTVENISQKYLPEKQESERLNLLKAFPRILRDFEVGYCKDKNVNFSMENVREYINEYVDIILDTTSPIEDKLSELTPEKQFRFYLGQLANLCGLNDFIFENSEEEEEGIDDNFLEKIPEFNPNDLKKAAGYFETQNNQDPSSNLLQCVSEYADIREIGLRNMEAIWDLESRIKNGVGSIKNSEAILRKLYKMNQDFIFSEYDKRCRSKDSNISIYEKAIIVAIFKESLYEPLEKIPSKISHEFTTFATSEFREYLYNSKIFLVKERIRELSLGTKYSRDALRMDLKDIHLCLFMMSVFGDTSKSFTILGIGQRMCEGTFEKVSHQTDKSELTGELNRNGGTVAWEEMDKSLFVPSKNTDSNRCGLMKDRMTNHELVTKSIKITSDGRRITEVFRSQAITCFIGACNWNILEFMDQAFCSRAHIIPFEKSTVETTILDLTLQESLLNGNEKVKKQRLIKQYKRRQAMFLELERLVWCKGLTDVSLNVALLVLKSIENAFIENQIEPPTFRAFKRSILLARINCINAACENVFDCKGSKFEGKKIEVENFKEIDRELAISFEHIVAAIGEQLDMYVDPFEEIVRKSLNEWFKSGNKSNINQKIKRMYNFGPSPNNPEKGERDTVLNHNYVSFRRKRRNTSNILALKEISTELEKFAKTLKDTDYKPSPDRIYDVLKKWSELTIKSKSYEELNGFIVVKEQSEESLRPLIEIEMDQVCFHYSLIENENGKDVRSLIIKCIEKIGNAKGQAARSMVFDSDPKNPYIRRIIKTVGNDYNEPIIIKTNIKMDEYSKRILNDLDDADNNMSPDRKNFSQIIIEDDIDIYIQKERTKLLYINSYPIESSYKKTDIFGINSSVSNPTDSLFSSDSEDEEEENNKKFFFLGEPIENYLKFENFVPVKEQIENAYKTLDTQHSVLELESSSEVRRCVEELEDTDFDREYYFIESIVDDELDQVIGKRYHWDFLGITLFQYKLICHSPIIFNNFLNLKYYRTNKLKSFNVNKYIKDIDSKLRQLDDLTREKLINGEPIKQAECVDFRLASRTFNQETGTFILNKPIVDLVAMTENFRDLIKNGNKNSKSNLKKRKTIFTNSKRNPKHVKTLSNSEELDVDSIKKNLHFSFSNEEKDYSFEMKEDDEEQEFDEETSEFSHNIADYNNIF